MATFDKETTENTAKPRGSGGGLQSKSLPDTAQPKGAGGGLQSKAHSNSDAGAPQQPEDGSEPEASDQAPTPTDS